MTIIVAELQRQNVLKFEIFQMNSFEDMVVQSRSGPTKIRQISVSSQTSTQILIVKCLLFMTMYSYKNTK